MAQFESHNKQIEASGAQAVLIAAEKRSGLFSPEKYFETHPISFPFLLDEDRKVTKAYGVYHRFGMDALRIARPATFVVEQTGILRFVYVSTSQTDRAPFDKVIGSVPRV